jgi:hypothetical protein
VPAVRHPYFQDSGDPGALYFLPDRFVVQRRSEPPHRPWLSLTVLDEGNKLSMGYVAVPEFTDERIDAATVVLRGNDGVPDDLPPLKLFPAGDARLRIKLPKGDAASGGPGYADQGSSANIQTHLAINGNVTLSIDDFKSVFDALVSDNSDLLSGFVDVTVEKEKYQVPFVVRAAQFAGPTLDVSTTPDAGSGGLKLVLKNGIESPIEVSALPVELTRDGKPIASQIVSTTPGLPLTLGASSDDTPAGAIEVLVAPDDKAGGNLQALPDLSKTRVVPSSEALFESILDPTTQMRSTSEYNVQLLASLFTPPPPPAEGAPPAPPLVVLVEFAPSGAIAEFVVGQQPAAGSPFLSQKVTIRLPLRDYLLGELSGNKSPDSYRIHVLTTEGKKSGAPQPIETPGTIYILNLSV